MSITTSTIVVGTTPERLERELDRLDVETKSKPQFFENDIVVFLVGPLIFLIIIAFTGNQIFYHGQNSKERRKTVVLLS